MHADRSISSAPFDPPALPDNLTAPRISNHQNQNHNDFDINHCASNVQRKSPYTLLGSIPSILSARSMETLSFNQTAAGRQAPYMNQTYRGIGSQISPSQNYASNLGILNVESFDDGRSAVRAKDASEKRLKHDLEATHPFGMVSDPKTSLDQDMRAESDELDEGLRRRKKPRIEAHSEDDEEARKKARGRPRVDTKDETAADRRRTQIRMAQRAYRHRKETTISSLEKRVQDLRGANEEMSNIFISLYDFAVGKGLLSREPEFGHLLQSTTERFLALAKTAQEQDELHGEDTEKPDEEGEIVVTKPKRRRTSPKIHRETTPSSSPQPPPPPPILEPESETTNPWGGYTLAKEDSSTEEIDLSFQSNQHYRSREDLQVITRPTEHNASFPFDLLDLQQYRVEIPQMEDYSQIPFRQSQLPLPNSHSYYESTFARRIHRSAIERGLRLITTADPSSESFQKVFRFALLYEDKNAIEARLRRLHSASTKDTLQEWRAPFVHIGGSGTFYPMDDGDMNDVLVPKIRTGYSMGPFPSSVSQALATMDDDMICNMPGFEGDFFDPNDVEGYIRGRGLNIPPAADFVSGEIDLYALAEMRSPRTYSSDTAPIMSPQTPRSPADNLLLNDEWFESGKNDGSLNFSKDLSRIPNTFSYNSSDISESMDESLIDPTFNVMPDQSFISQRTPEVVVSDSRSGEKRLVTINVQTLLDEIVSRGVCLGRAPGFRPADVNAAILAAVKAGF